MINILSAELYKLKYSGTFYICLLITAIVAVVGVATDTTGTAIVMAESVSGMIPIFLAIVVTNVACDDYEKNTIKNIVSSGNSRAHIYMGKALTAIVVGMIFFIIDGGIATIAGYVMNGFGAQITAVKAMESLCAQLLLIVVYALTFHGFSGILKSSKFSLMISIIYTLFAALIPWALGTYVLHTDLSAFSLDTLANNVGIVNLSGQMAINFVIYGGIALLLNLIGYMRFKREEV